MTIQFTPQEEAWLTTQARQQGLHPDEVVRRLVDERIPSLVAWPTTEDTAPAIDAETAAAITLLQSWIDEAPTDPEEIRESEKQLGEFLNNLNTNRITAGERPLFP